MTTKLKRLITLSLLLLLTIPMLMISCEKEPGSGGKSTIYGKVMVKEYNATFTVLQETYYGPEVWVYLIYGDDRDYGDRIQTSYDGTWEFKYLRPGSYKVYALSKDSTLQTNALIPVIMEVEVPNKKQDIEVPDLFIFN
ncbi:MAG: hypothetical protein IH596_01290 [Bacteroidales bacterium]|nr:hypothetical protein [Bacteroidales bacterium]